MQSGVNIVIATFLLSPLWWIRIIFWLSLSALLTLIFFDENDALCEVKIQEFTDIGLRYLDAVRQVGGDKATAEKGCLERLMSLLRCLTTT